MFESTFQNCIRDFLLFIFNWINWYYFFNCILFTIIFGFGTLAVLYDIKCIDQTLQEISISSFISKYSICTNNGNSENNETFTLKKPQHFLIELNKILALKNDTFEIFCEKFSHLYSEVYSNSKSVSPEFSLIILKRIVIERSSQINLPNLQKLSKIFLFRLGLSKYILKSCYSKISNLDELKTLLELRNIIFLENCRIQNIINRERTLAMRQLKQKIRSILCGLRFVIEIVAKIG